MATSHLDPRGTSDRLLAANAATLDRLLKPIRPTSGQPAQTPASAIESPGNAISRYAPTHDWNATATRIPGD